MKAPPHKASRAGLCSLAFAASACQVPPPGPPLEMEHLARVNVSTRPVEGGARYISLDVPGVALREGQTITWAGTRLRVERGGVWLPPALHRPGTVTVSVPGVGAFLFDPTHVFDASPDAAGGASATTSKAPAGGGRGEVALRPIGSMGPEGGAFFPLPGDFALLAPGTLVQWGGRSLTITDGGLWLPPDLLASGPATLTFPGGERLTADPSQLLPGMSPHSGAATASGPATASPGTKAEAGSLGGLVVAGTFSLSAGLNALQERITPGRDATKLASTSGGAGVSVAEMLTRPGSVRYDVEPGTWLVNLEGASSLDGATTPTGGLLAALFGPDGGAAAGLDTGAGAGGALVAGDGGGILAGNGGSVVSSNGGSVVSSNGGSLVSSNGAAAVIGYPYFPLAPPPARLQLMQLSLPVVPVERVSSTGVREYMWPQHTRVRAVTSSGEVLSDWVKTDTSGAFVLELSGAVPAPYFVQAELQAPIPGTPIHRAYAMAMPPAAGAPALLVPVNANTTVTAGSTLHLLTYIPPEQVRLQSLAGAYSTAVTSLQDQRRLNNREEADLSLYSSALGTATSRQGTLGAAWAAFVPFAYPTDLDSADRAIHQADAELMSKADGLAGVYGSIYRMRSANAFNPGSFLAIDPSTPPLPDVDHQYLAKTGASRGR